MSLSKNGANGNGNGCVVKVYKVSYQEGEVVVEVAKGRGAEVVEEIVGIGYGVIGH